jgi:branched-chain amino acid transport system permease protein
MDLSFLLVQALTGLANASSLFILASGLTIVFGVTRIVNFAHGSLYMLGAYLGVSIVPALLDVDRSLVMFALGVIVAAIGVGIIGVIMEIALLRRLYQAPELFQLLATFGVLLVVQDLVLKIWGPLDILGPRAPALRGAINVFGQRFSAYEAFLIVLGPVVLLFLWLLMRRTRFGMLIRAATQDREMVGALGVNQKLLFTGTLFLGAFLAGFGGALQIPRAAANPHMDLAVITEAFVVTVVGGMGSIPGAFLAALIIGQLQAFGILVFPKITLVLVFALMAVVLILRPDGLMGRADTSPARMAAPEGIAHLRKLATAGKAALTVLLLTLAALPWWGDAYALKLGAEVLIFALAAFSLNFLIGNGGLVTFGHAAYFGLGAYGAGLLSLKLGLPMPLALIAAPLAGGLGAWLFGVFIMRLSGIYLAMLTLAAAQIVHAVAFQWVEVTGGDNGLVGIWPPEWASGRAVYYGLTLALVAGSVALLWRIIHAPFGATMRAIRDSDVRASAVGIDIYAHRVMAFGIAGAAAGLAGGLYAFLKGSIDPTVLSVSTSVDFLVMALAGGVQSVVGPLIGAAAFHLAKDALMPLTDYWRALLGLSIIATVLVAPRGIAGAASAFPARWLWGAR